MTETYRFDPNQARFTVRAFASGMLSALGHSPTFAVRDFSGQMRFENGEIDGMALDLSIRADSLDLMDRVSASDRDEIGLRMKRDVLETASSPEIGYRADKIPAEMASQGLYRLRIGGQLALHGVTRPQPVQADLEVFRDGMRLHGGCSLRLSDYRIKPVTALGGAIKLKDELSLAFDLLARPEGS
jgi:polyisoprenoid-binding protein YceI